MLPLLLLAFLSRGQQINWRNDLSWTEIKATALKEHKFIFLDVYATWCGPCIRMDNEVYKNPAVVKAVNGNFIAAKVQIDSTQKDDDQVKKWRTDAATINKSFKIDVLPSFLFFSPEGKLVFRESAFHNKADFSKILTEAQRDPIARYQESVEKLKYGKLSYAAMPDMIAMAVSMKDKVTPFQIGKAYKEGYLDHQKDLEAFTPEEWKTLLHYGYKQIKPTDRYFQYASMHRQQIRKLLSGDDIATVIIGIVIRKQMIYSKLQDSAGKALPGLQPDWDEMTKKIVQQYPPNAFPMVNAGLNVMDARIDYLSETQDWDELCKQIWNKMEKYGVSSFGIASFNFPCATFVMHCKDSILLKHVIDSARSTVIQWILNENLKGADKANFHLYWSNDFGNLAGLLYKSGRKDEAVKWIEWELKLLDADLRKGHENDPAYRIESSRDYDFAYKPKEELLRRMKKGDPIDDTWQPEWFF